METADPVAQNGRYTAHVHFREDRALVAVAHARAEALGTQLASVMRGLLRQWLARDTTDGAAHQDAMAEWLRSKPVYKGVGDDR